MKLCDVTKFIKFPQFCHLAKNGQKLHALGFIPSPQCISSFFSVYIQPSNNKKKLLCILFIIFLNNLPSLKNPQQGGNTLRRRNEAKRAQFLPVFGRLAESRALQNLINLATSHGFIPSPQCIASLIRTTRIDRRQRAE